MTSRPRTPTPLALLLAAAALTIPATAAAQEAPAPPPADPADVESIESIMKAVYDVISGDAGVARDWDRFRSLFAPGATLSPVGRSPDACSRSSRCWPWPARCSDPTRTATCAWPSPTWRTATYQSWPVDSTRPPPGSERSPTPKCFCLEPLLPTATLHVVLRRTVTATPR